jgi:hypothetical protein
MEWSIILASSKTFVFIIFRYKLLLYYPVILTSAVNQAAECGIQSSSVNEKGPSFSRLSATSCFILIKEQFNVSKESKIITTKIYFLEKPAFKLIFIILQSYLWEEF